MDSNYFGEALEMKPRIRPRIAPRRKRPEIFHPAPAVEGWPAISKRLRLKWWGEQTANEPLLCALCGKPIRSYSELVPDHIIPGKMGGCKDNSDSNLQPAHWICNAEKGSQRDFKKVSA